MNNQPRYGFTLLELLLTLTLFSTVMALALNTFFQFNDQSKSLNDTIALRQEARVLERMLRHDLNATVFLTEFVDYNQKNQSAVTERKSGLLGLDDKYGENDKDTIHLHVNSPSGFYRSLEPRDDPELHEVSYFLDTDDSENVTFKRREEFYLDDDMTEGDDSIIYTISEHLVSFNVSYFEGTSEETVDSWDATEQKSGSSGYNKLPSGVKVSIVMKSETGATYQKEFQVNLRPSLGVATWK